MSNSFTVRWLAALALGCFLLLLSPLEFAQNVINTDGSALNLSLTPLTVNGDLTNSFDSAVTVNGSGSLIPSLIVTGNLSNSFTSTITASGLLSGAGLITPAAIQVGGNLTNDGSSTVQIQNHSVLSVSGNIINSGQFLTGNTIGDVGLNGVVIGGTFINNPGGMLSLNAGGDTLNAAALVNAGYINVNNGAVVSVSGVVSQSAGLVDVKRGGSMSVANYVVNGGTLQIDGSLSASSLTLGSGGLEGQGSITSTVANNSGIVEPGTPGAPGALTMTGGFTQAAQGEFLEQIGPTSFGELLDTGNIDLNGTLDISLQGFIPALGTQYWFIDSSDTLNGIFTNIIGSIIDSNEYFAVIYYPNAVELCVEATGSQVCSAGPPESLTGGSGVTTSLAGGVTTSLTGGSTTGSGGGVTTGSQGGVTTDSGAGATSGPGAGIVATPESSSFLLLATGLLAIAFYGKRRYGRNGAQSRAE